MVTANLAALWAVLDEIGHADRFTFGVYLFNPESSARYLIASLGATF